MRYLHLSLLSCATAAALAFTGCGSTVMNNSMAGSPPSVSGLGAQANGVAPNRAITVQFNEAMDPATINSQTVMLKDANGNAVAGTVTYGASFDVAAFQPSPALQTNASYTFTVTTGAKSAAGAPMQSDYRYNFTTRGDTDDSPIGVKTVTPANGATCVSPNSLIMIDFTEGADYRTVNSTNIVVTGPGNAVIPAAISYNVSSAAATLAPSGALPAGVITVTVSNVADAAGVAMTKPYSWSFSTNCAGSGGPATTQFVAPLFSMIGAETQAYGNVSVDTHGMVTTQLTNGSPNSALTEQFCEAVNPLAPNLPTSCMQLGTLFTDSNGNATSTAKFPKSGNWAGDFTLSDSAGHVLYATDLPSSGSHASYMAVLLPNISTNNGADSYNGTTQDPLTSGTVTSDGTNVTFTVNGAAAQKFYQTNVSETNYIDSSGTYMLCSFTTDGMGNGSCSSPLSAGSGGDIFQVEPQYTGNGFIGGFAVPQ